MSPPGKEKMNCLCWLDFIELSLFPGHPSLSINQISASLWIALFKHERLRAEPELVNVIQPWIEVVARKFVKTSACTFDKMDFYSDEDYTAFHLYALIL